VPAVQVDQLVMYRGIRHAFGVVWRRPVLAAGAGVVAGAASSAPAHCDTVSAEVGLAVGFGIAGFLLGTHLGHTSSAGAAAADDPEKQGYNDALAVLDCHFSETGAAEHGSDASNKNVFADRGINHVVLLTWKPGTPESLIARVRHALVRATRRAAGALCGAGVESYELALPACTG
jgi:hypothetical protein